MSARYLFLWVICICLHFPELEAAVLTGDVTDVDNREPVAGVHIHNIYTGQSVWSDTNGRFEILAHSGELIEFKKDGYKITRLRVPPGQIPPYFKIMIQKGPQPLEDLLDPDKPRNYREDSLEYDQLYRHLLRYPRLTGIETLKHPFSAMSKKNQQIWAFQDNFAYFEQEKYIDYTFNETIISNLTGLKGDSLRAYMRKFRPSYVQLRQMNDFVLHLYIKETVHYYRTGVRRDYKPSIQRSAH
mgnify:CR=1 FL=1|jgi:hypothetical protein